MPTLKQLEINAKENAENWQKYVEDDKAKRIYMPNNGKPKSEEEKKEGSKHGNTLDDSSSDESARLRENEINVGKVGE